MPPRRLSCDPLMLAGLRELARATGHSVETLTHAAIAHLLHRAEDQMSVVDQAVTQAQGMLDRTCFERDAPT